MFALGIHYLNGWSMAAADGARKEQAEWPPHPDRVFMALAAAWFETGEDPAEGKALRWLESLPPPAIAASDYTTRATVVSYVPVNDRERKRTLTDVGGLKKLSPKKFVEKLKEEGLALLPEYRPRQPRGFPVAIPHDPTVRLIWHDAEPDSHYVALEQLAAKVTHIGHSASFTQVWLENGDEKGGCLMPTDAIAERKLRIPFTGRLNQLVQAYNQKEWFDYHDLCSEIKRTKAELKTMRPPPRTPWGDFPDTVILTPESQTKQHPAYQRAKTGDAVAATNLVNDLVEDSGIASIRMLISEFCNNGKPALVSAHSREREGINAIPIALAKLLSEKLAVEYEASVVQTNVVSHTGADGYGRLARQANFTGKLTRACEYIMVDDFVGQGGTLANLRGWVEKQGGKVIGAVALTGKPYSAILTSSQEQLDELRRRHGSKLEKWWREHFGHAFDCLTQSEARYLSRSPDVDTIRNRIAAAKQKGNGTSGGRSPREQKEYIKQLEDRLQERFPDGQRPVTQRPGLGRWQGYSKYQDKPSPTIMQGSVFDPRFIVLSIRGKRVSLLTTLKLTAALRGLLMTCCPDQPPPEWFSGHRANGTPSTTPHIALIPLPFVGAEHADGSIMGLGVILPASLDPQEIKHTLEVFLHDQTTGLTRQHTLFNGQWFECRLELETRERPPQNLHTHTWTRPSRVWASVTPVVLNRHFDGKDKWEQAADSVKDACKHTGLPEPREVVLSPVSMVEGVPHVRNYPKLIRKKDNGKQSHNHAIIVFDEPVNGPVLIGAGRFKGYGLCRPMD